MRITRKSSCTGHQAALYALAKSHTPGHFLTAGGDGWITEWNLADTETGKVVVNVESKVFSMAVSPIDWPEPLILAGNMTGGLHWANREQPALTKNIQHHTKSIFDIFWLDDEVFTVGGDGCLTRWNATKKTAMETYQLSNRALRCIAFCPIQQVFAVGASDGCIYYLRRDDFALLEKVSAHDNSVFSVAWARDGQQLISGGRDALLKVWSPFSTNINSQPGHWYTINHIALSPDGRLTATASRDKTIKIWKTDGMELLKVVETIRDLGHVNSVNRLLWMDEDTLVSCSDDRSAVVWNCIVDPQIDSLQHAQIPLALSRNSPLTPPQSSSPEPLNPEPKKMLTINNIHHAYQSGHPILQGIQLDIPAGERHGILGPNGAGKTTFFHLLSGQLPVKAGAIDFEGHPLKKEQVSLLEAEPWFYPYMTGMEYLRFFRDDKAAIERWNNIFQLPLNELAEEYSTGMKKKLGLMGVLLQPERPVLILDEPFNGVDYESNEKIMALLEHRATDQRILLISSHILHTLTRVCDRISVLREGRIARTYERAQFDELEATVREGVSDEVKKMMEGLGNGKSG